MPSDLRPFFPETYIQYVAEIVSTQLDRIEGESINVNGTSYLSIPDRICMAKVSEPGGSGDGGSRAARTLFCTSASMVGFDRKW